MAESDKVEKEVKEDEKKEEKQFTTKIELTPEQYNAMLDDMAELEALRAAKPKKEKEEEDEELDVEKLAREGKKTKAKEEEETLDLDNMTNTQLANAILKEIDKRNNDRLNPLEVTVETLRMLREIDKAEGKHEDFWDYGEQVQKMCVTDPNLSVEDAYILAKSKAPVKKEKGEKETVPTKTERLLKLPPRVHGEKPGVAAGTTINIDKGKTVKSAAEKAWEDTLKDRNSI